jgi:hypothetical protein
MATVTHRLTLAASHGVGADVAAQMVAADSDEQANEIALAALEEDGFEPMDSMQTGGGSDDGIDIQAIIEQTISQEARRK